MLNQETKKKIDTARDILVGKVPDPKAQVEQITTALIYKFMDDMDKQAASLPKGKPSFFTNGYEKYSWNKMMDAKLGGQERLNLYVEALEQMGKNKYLPQLFRDVFKDAFLPYRDPETLNLFLKEISTFSYDHSENLGDAFEYLLSVLGAQGDAGQFRTPRHIIDFIVEVVDPKKGETILDPACGTAGFLISAYKHIQKENKNKPLTPDEKKRLTANLTGYDISPDMVKLSLVNMYLHGFSSPNIFEYDTLTSDERWDERFDVMMANPPFMTPKGGIRPHKRFMVQANRAEVLFVDYILEHLNNTGRAGIIVPEGIIFQSAGAYKQLRKLLVEDGLYAVVSLPGGVFNPYSGVKTSILFFDNQLSKQSKEVIFIKILNDGFDLGAQRRPIDRNDLPHAIEILKAQKEAIKSGKKNVFLKEGSLFAWSATKAKIAESGDYNLSGERYNRVAKVLHQKWEMVELRDVCKILNGYAFKSENYVEKGIRVIRITNVQKGEIVDDSPKFYPVDSDEPVENYKLLEKDLLISLTGNVGRVGLLKKELLPAALNQRVACLRINQEKIFSDFLYYLLNTDSFESDCIKSSSGVAQKNLSTVWLSKNKIPLPPIEVQKEIVDELASYKKVIDGAKQILQHHKPSIKIDQNWERVKLSSIAKFVRGPFGGSLKKVIFKPNGYLVYEQYHAINNDFSFARYYIDNKKFEEMKRFEVASGDMLISCSGTMGKIAIVPSNHKPGIINQALLKLTPDKNKILTEYLKAVLESPEIQKRYFQNQSGAAIQNVASVKVLSEIEVPLPDIETQNRIVQQLQVEQGHLESAKRMIEIYENKINSKIAEVWGE